MKSQYLITTIIIVVVSLVNCQFIQQTNYKDKECNIVQVNLYYQENVCYGSGIYSCSNDFSQITLSSYEYLNCTGEIISTSTFAITDKCDNSNDINGTIVCTQNYVPPNYAPPNTNINSISQLLYTGNTCPQWTEEDVALLQVFPPFACIYYDENTYALSSCEIDEVTIQLFNTSECTGSPVDIVTKPLPINYCTLGISPKFNMQYYCTLGN